MNPIRDSKSQASTETDDAQSHFYSRQKREWLAKVLPHPMAKLDIELSRDEKVEQIAFHFKKIMETLGLDLTNDSLQDTPHRVAKMYIDEIFSGLDPENFPKITTIENTLGYDEMVSVKDITLISSCEHHFVTIDGLATVAYIPRKKVIGLSKINRITQYFAKRPQVQERLTKQIADCLSEILETPDVAVRISAKHYCVAQRGIKDTLSSTTTTDLRGAFKADSNTRAEFLTLCAEKR